MTGIAAFVGLSVGTAGYGYNLFASARGLVGATSRSFSVIAAPDSIDEAALGTTLPTAADAQIAGVGLVLPLNEVTAAMARPDRPSQALETQALATQALETQALATQALATQALETQALETQHMATQHMATEHMATHLMATQLMANR